MADTTMDTERVSNAILLHGMAGIGKLSIAKQFTQLLLCQKPINTTACHQCHACHLHANASHPDFIEVEQAKNNIKIDSIRALEQPIRATTSLGQRRVILLHYAESMNRFAANALLKLLEDAPQHTVFILVSNHLNAIIPTIRSRCVQVHLSCESSDAAIDWLKSEGIEATQAIFALQVMQGAPLLAAWFCKESGITQFQSVTQDWLDLFAGNVDAIQVSQRWDKIELEQLLLYIQYLLHAVQAQHANVVLPHGLQENVKQLSGALGQAAASKLYDLTCDWQRERQQHATLNQTYFIDAIVAALLLKGAK